MCQELAAKTTTKCHLTSDFGATGSKVPEEDVKEMLKLPPGAESRVANANEGSASRACHSHNISQCWNQIENPLIDVNQNPVVVVVVVGRRRNKAPVQTTYLAL